jgi:hypothetical protein
MFHGISGFPLGTGVGRRIIEGSLPMRRAYLGTSLACTLPLLALASLPALSGANDSNSITNLAGRWAGEGTMTPPSGPNESFRCVITYFPSQDGSRVKQNLRCNGPTNKFDAATHLQIDGAQVSGRWTDNVYSLTGSVTGQVTKDGFDIQLTGQFFDAKMTVVSTPCEQSVTVTPGRADYMRELAAVLRKC